MNISDYMIRREDSMLLVIDIQEKLIKAIPDKVADRLIANTEMLIEAASLFSMPVMVSEQYRKGLGQTVEKLFTSININEIHDKTFFNCMYDENIKRHIESVDRKNVIVTGIEAHVCVFQTVISLLYAGKNVIVISDAVASRKKENWKTALDEMARAGAKIYPAETAAFILLEKAGTPEFKSLSPLFK